jgi:multiple sugar transport system permease protein/raffinose/stachyose/melibiose transport system permease protein
VAGRRAEDLRLVTVATPVLPRRGRLGRQVSLAVWGFLLLPAAIEVGLVFWPAANSFYLSLTKWNGAGPPRNVGLGNFRSLLSDDIFRQALRNNVIWAIGFGGLSVAGGLALAVALNRPRRGVGLYRSAIYLPMVFSLAVTGLFWRVQYQPDGSVNTALGLLHLAGLERQWLADPTTALYAVLVAAVWRQVGYVMVLYLAGLKGTDPSLDDAAAVDGAGAWQRFRYVTWPQLRGVNTVVFAVTVIDSLRTFDIVWSMTQGGPYHKSELLSTYMYEHGFTFLNLGYASAIAVVIFLLAIVFIITYLVRATNQETD